MLTTAEMLDILSDRDFPQTRCTYCGVPTVDGACRNRRCEMGSVNLRQAALLPLLAQWGMGVLKGGAGRG